ncbi:MAG: FAD:protein FMN transferase [Bacteroides sp.]|nr:FAD:protein FMN transferase [Bacteroides sp.]
MQAPKQSNYIWLVLLFLGTVYVLNKNNKQPEYRSIQGMVFGTLYTITYQYDEDLQPEIEEAFEIFNQSLSPFYENSIISRINRNEEVATDTLFQNVFERSIEISEQTDGAFDITVAALANAWGFGFKKGEFPDSLTIDSLLQITGYTQIGLEEDRVVKKDPRVQISCSAIAKGYAVDVIGNLLSAKGITNYMVDIGGEIVARGNNPKSEHWRIGINRPVDDSLSINQELQIILQLTDVGLATSGNYRNFYYKDGKKYAHTIDPRTGYPVQHTLLSSTVMAEDCMTADALATAFMVIGMEEAKKFIARHLGIEACFIYSDENGELQTELTPDMEKYVVKR